MIATTSLEEITLTDEQIKLLAKSGPWTQFWDMHSGGRCKTKWDKIYIRASEDKAKILFEGIFGRDWDNTTCECCGADYSIFENETLIEATAYERNCEWDKANQVYIEEQPSPDKFGPRPAYLTLSEYVKKPNIVIVAMVFPNLTKLENKEYLCLGK